MPKGAPRRGSVTTTGLSGNRNRPAIYVPRTTTTSSSGKTTTSRGLGGGRARAIVGDSGLRSINNQLAGQASRNSSAPIRASSTTGSSVVNQATKRAYQAGTRRAKPRKK